MRIKKKIFAVLLMLCIVLQMLPNPVFADTISSPGGGITYNGPMRICPNSDLTFSCTTIYRDKNGAINPYVAIEGKGGENRLEVNGSVVNDIYFGIASKDELQRFYSNACFFLNITFHDEAGWHWGPDLEINVKHIDDNYDHMCDDCGEKSSDHIDNDRDHYCDTCKVRVSCSGGIATCTDKAICEICGKPYGEADLTNHVGDTEIRNAKAATCTEDGYEGDIYCKSCNTKLSSGEPIAASGHKDTNKDHSCDVCYAKVGEHIDTNHDHKCDYGCTVAIGKHEDVDHDHKCDYGCSVAIGDHKAGESKHTCDYCGAVMSECSGGTATCKDKAICEICGKPYGEVDLTNHVGDTEIRNAKAATCTEDGYEGDIYCKSCNTKLSSGEPIAASGHKDDNKDHSCDVCGAEVGEHIDADHDHKCDYGCTVAIGDHKAGEGKHTCDYCGAVMSECSGGTATCKDKAICEICGKPYGEVEPTNHVGDTEIRDAKVATCTEDGYTGDTYCKSCNTKLSSGEPIAASGHKDTNKDHSCDVCYAKVGEHIDTDYDHKCDYGCSVAIGDHKAGEGKHTCDYCGAVMSECSGGTATCKDKAICEICGNPYGEVDPTNHVGDTEIRNAKVATCTADGYTGDTYCKSCNTKLSSGEPIAASGHKDDNKDHSCDVCGAEVGEHIDADHDHKCDYGCTVAIGDHKAGKGKHTCDYCGEVMSKCSGGTATCKDKAICGKPYGEVDPTNHVGDTEIRDAKVATCTEDGYTGDTYCKSCNTKLSSGEPIAAFGHTYKDEVTKEATTESAGIKTYTCEKCGDSYTEEIAKLPAKTEPTKPSKPENRVEPTKPSKPENRVEPSKPTEPQKQVEPPKTANQTSFIEVLVAMFVNGIAVPSMQLITSIWQLILQFIKMLLAAAF